MTLAASTCRPARSDGGTGGSPPVREVLDAMPAVGLDDLNGRAALQTRVDRKYLVTVPTLTAMLLNLGTAVSVLDIGGRRTFGYSSVYFDTSDLLCYRDHRQGRRRRFKVRTRTYTDSEQCMLEVKALNPRGATVKHRIDHPIDAAGRLSAQGRLFAFEILNGHPAVAGLGPTVATDYRRSTLLDRCAGSRITIDVGLSFSDHLRTVETPGDTVVIETKSAGRPVDADRVLRDLGCRPVSVSKYCIGVALLHPEVAANRWNRILRRNFGAGEAAASQALPAQVHGLTVAARNTKGFESTGVATLDPWAPG